jgi:predicted ABC-type sugar transport system permease subunit
MSKHPYLVLITVFFAVFMVWFMLNRHTIPEALEIIGCFGMIMSAIVGIQVFLIMRVWND